MTDHRPSDEVISASLDGAATPGEAAAVEASAAARARRDELDAIRSRVGEPVVPPPGARDAAVAAALGVHDHELAPPLAPARGPADLEAQRARRRPRRALVPVLGAVASVVFVVAVAAIAVRGTGRNEATSASGAAHSSQGQDQAVTLAESEPGPAGAAPAAPGMSAPPAPVWERSAQADAGGQAATAPVGPADLGVVTDATTLGRAVAGALASAPNALTPYLPPNGAPACEAAHRATDPGLGALVLVGEARYQGTPAPVLAYRSAPGAPVRAFLYQPATCRIMLVDPA